MNKIKRLMIQTVNSCNSSCMFCPYENTGKIEYMNNELFKNIIKQLSKLKTVENILLYLMNEPLLDNDLFHKIEFIKKIMPKVKVHFLTNGILLKKNIDNIINSPLDWIGISVPAIHGNIYNKLTKRNDGNKIIKNITESVRYLIKKRGQEFIKVNFTGVSGITDNDYVYEVNNYWKVNGIKNFESFLEPVSRAGNTNIIKSPIHNNIFGCKTIWANEMFHILCDGSVIPCCMDWSKKEIIGNVNNNSILDIWESDKYNLFRKKLSGKLKISKDFLCLKCEDAITESNDIIFVNCPAWVPDCPPLGIASIISYIRDKGFRSILYDMNVIAYNNIDDKYKHLWEMKNKSFWEQEDNRGIILDIIKPFFNELLDIINRESLRYIAFSVASPKQNITYECIKFLRENNINIPIIIGGPAIFNKEERKIFEDISLFPLVMFKGQGESQVYELLKENNIKDINGSIYLEDNKWKENGIGKTIKEDIIVKFDEFDLTKYTTDSLVMEWSRGCVGNCSFCQTNCLWPEYSEKCIDPIINELKFYKKKYSSKKVISLVDSAINGNPKRLKKILKAIIDNSLQFRFSASIIARNFDEQTAELLKKAGFYRIELGIESGSEKILKKMRKNIKLSHAIETLNLLRKYKIETVIYIIVGFPGETEKDFQDTLFFLKNNANNISLVRSVNSLCLMENTDITLNPKKYNIIIPEREISWGYKWVSTNNKNTQSLREERARRVLFELDILGIKHELSASNEFIEQRKKQRTILINCPPMTKLGECIPPLGIISIASYLKRQNIDVKVIDCNVELFRYSNKYKENWNSGNIENWKKIEFIEEFFKFNKNYFDELIARIEKFKPVFIGLSVQMASFPFSIFLFHLLKERFKEIKFVFGGNFTPIECEIYENKIILGQGKRSFEEIINEFKIKKNIKINLEISKKYTGNKIAPDHIVIRDGEEAMYRIIINNIFNNNIIKGNIISNNIETIFEIPYMNINNYGICDFNIDYSKYGNDFVQTYLSRGCINHCAFCNDHYFSLYYRYRYPEIVFNELKFHYKNGRKKFDMCDLTINANLFQLEQICDLIIKEKMDICIAGQAMIRDDISEKLIYKMKKAGFLSLTFGVESFSDRVLTLMGKKFSSDSALRLFKLLRKHGIEVHINLIVGFPGETEEDFSLTINFLKKYGKYITMVPNISPCFISPNSPLENHSEDHEIILPEENHFIYWYDYNGLDLKTRIERFFKLKKVLEELKLDFFYNKNSLGLAILKDWMIDPGNAKIEKEPEVILIMAPPWDTQMPPLGLAYISQFLENNNIKNNIIDLNILFYKLSKNKKLWDPEFLKFWSIKKNCDEFFYKNKNVIEKNILKNNFDNVKVIGFSVNESNIYLSKLISEFIKKIYPSIKIVFGGSGIYFEYDRYEIFKECKALDYCVCGDGEKPFYNLFKAIKDNKNINIKGISTRNNIKIEQYKENEYIEFPRFKSFKINDYTTKKIPIILSKGCIYRCNFCNDNIISFPYRQIDISKVINALQFYYTNGWREFHFCDLLINGNIDKTLELAKQIVSKKMYIEWSAQSSIRKEMDFKFCKTLFDSGCRSLVFGAESFSDNVLIKMNKQFNAEIAKKVFKACKLAQLKVMINLIVGFPGEVEEDFNRTLRFLTDNKDNIYQISSVSILVITPNCRIEKEPDIFNINKITNDHWKNWETENNNYEIRKKRLEILLEHIKKLGKFHIMDNLYYEKLKNIKKKKNISLYSKIVNLLREKCIKIIK